MHLFVDVAPTGGFLGEFGAYVFDAAGNRSDEGSYSFSYRF